MYDTLWIGCSHSAGLYDINNNILSSDKGIANRLAEAYNQKWKILSFPGEGNHIFMEAMKVISDAGYLKNFRNVIVQQTYEPRLNFYNIEEHQKIFYRVKRHMEEDSQTNRTLNATLNMHDKKVFSIIGREFYESHEKNFVNEKINFVDVASRISEEIDPRDPELEYYGIWTQAALDYIKLISEKHNCKFYTFRWFGSYITQPKTHPKKGLITGEENMLDLIRRENLQDYLTKPGSHPTEKIIDFAFKVLVKELDEVRYN